MPHDTTFPSHPQAGEVVFDTYRLLSVGRKRPGNVQLFQAQDVPSARLVAIKRQPLQKGDPEAALLQRLNHSAIAAYIGHVTTAGESFIIQEWIEGERLQAYKRQLALAEVLTLGYQLAEVLTYLYGLRVVHGDLDDQNVLLGQGKRLVVIDFGEAQQFPPEDEDFALWVAVEITQSRKLLGSLLQPSVPRAVRRTLLDASYDNETASDLAKTLAELEGAL